MSTAVSALLFGSLLATRFVVATVSFFAVIETTTSGALLAACSKARFPAGLALGAALVVGLIPLLRENLRTINDAQRARGVELDRGPLRLRLRRIVSSAIPLFVHSAFCEQIGGELAALLADSEPEVVVGTATLGIPVAIEVSRTLGLDRYVIVQKPPKIHLSNALSEEVNSVTSWGPQTLLLDRRHLDLLDGRRTLVVDDAVDTGSSLEATLRLVRRAGAEVVGIGVILTEGNE